MKSRGKTNRLKSPSRAQWKSQDSERYPNSQSSALPYTQPTEAWPPLEGLPVSAGSSGTHICPTRSAKAIATAGALGAQATATDAGSLRGKGVYGSTWGPPGPHGKAREELAWNSRVEWVRSSRRLLLAAGRAQQVHHGAALRRSTSQMVFPL